MAIVYEKLLNLAIPTIEQTYAPKDPMLYALGVGLGLDPMDRGQLDFVFEKNLKVLPTFAVVLAHPGLWVRDFDTGIDAVKVVHGEHGEQGLILHRPLPSSGALIGRSRITGVVDKGEGRGALVMSERKISDHATGELLATVTQTAFCRGDGGFGGPSGPSPKPHELPMRNADFVCDIPAKHFGPKSGSTTALRASAQPRSSAMSSLFPTDAPNSAEPSSCAGSIEATRKLWIWKRSASASSSKICRSGDRSRRSAAPSRKRI
jgi:hypothetical protein